MVSSVWILFVFNCSPQESDFWSWPVGASCRAWSVMKLVVGLAVDVVTAVVWQLPVSVNTPAMAINLSPPCCSLLPHQKEDENQSTRLYFTFAPTLLPTALHGFVLSPHRNARIKSHHHFTFRPQSIVNLR